MWRFLLIWGLFFRSTDVKDYVILRFMLGPAIAGKFRISMVNPSPK